MRRLFLCLVIAGISISSCCRVDRNSILSYADLQDSLKSFIKEAHPIEFPEETPTLYYVLFHNIDTGNDTVAILMNGLVPFHLREGLKRIGAGEVDGYICEIIYDGFEHLPEIVNEENLTLNLDDYTKYGYDEELFDKPEYRHWYFSSGQYKQVERRAYIINRPHHLERLY